MANYANVVMAGIDRIMKDCARGLFGEDWAIQKINALTEAYTVYQKSLRNVDASKDSAIAARKDLEEADADFDVACHERDDAFSALDAMIEDL